MTETTSATASPAVCAADTLSLLGVGQTRSLPALSTLCQEGQVTDCFFLVTGGEFALAKSIAGERIVLSTLGPGSLLALMPALDGGPCAVTISALNDATVVVIPRDRLVALLERTADPNPALANVLSLLAIRRLRGATSALSAALLGALRSPECDGRIDPLRLARIQADGYGWQG